MLETHSGSTWQGWLRSTIAFESAASVKTHVGCAIKTFPPFSHKIRRNSYVNIRIIHATHREQAYKYKKVNHGRWILCGYCMAHTWPALDSAKENEGICSLYLTLKIRLNIDTGTTRERKKDWHLPRKVRHDWLLSVLLATIMSQMARSEEGAFVI